MLFQTPQFLCLLLAVLVGVALLRTQTLQLVMLLAASWLFYSAWNPWFLILLLYCTVNDYVIGLAIGGAKTPGSRRDWLIVSLVTNLGVLAVFKYADFFVDSLNATAHWLGAGPLLPALNITLPVGISFYTFHSLGYNIDVYRRKTEPERSFLKFAIYVAYFPQLVAGPILRARQFLPQLKGVLNLESTNLRSGAHLFLVGLFKKVAIADNVAPLANWVFQKPEGLPSAAIWLGIFAFGVQIYCDFSGYTDMARGVSRMLGLEIPINFNWPYFSTTITDFWRRWHISLSSWLRDYLYIPLGGNRRGELLTYRNLMLTMGLGGLWHGASWNFLIWGVYQGVLLGIERLMGWGEPRADATAKESKPQSVDTTAGLQASRLALGTGGLPLGLGALPFAATSALRWTSRSIQVLRWIICQYFVFLGWVLFRNTEWHHLVYSVRKYVLFDFDFRLASLGLGNVNPFLVLFILMAFVVLHSISYRIGGLANHLDRMHGWRLRLVYVVSVALLIALWPEVQTAFIYFQF